MWSSKLLLIAFMACSLLAIASAQGNDGGCASMEDCGFELFCHHGRCLTMEQIRRNPLNRFKIRRPSRYDGSRYGQENDDRQFSPCIGFDCGFGF